MSSQLPGDVPGDTPPVGFFGRTFLALRNRNFRLFFIGQMISNTGNWLTNVALTLFVLETVGKGVAVGFLAACQYGPILLLSVWAGAIADRSDKRQMLLRTQGLAMVQSVGLATVAFMPHPPLVGLYVLAVAGGVLLAFDNPLRRSFVNEMVPTEDLSNAVVLYSTIVNVSRIFGPALAGLLVVTLGYGWCFTIDALTYVAVLYCLTVMRPEELHRQPYKARTKGEIREGLRYVMSVPVLWISFVMLAAIGTLAYNFSVTLPLFVTGTLHGTKSAFTILYSIFSFGAVTSALLVASRGLVGLHHVISGAFALGIAMLLLACVSQVGVAMPMIFLLGMASILYTTASTALIQIEAQPTMRGRVIALQTVLMIGTTPIGGPLVGWLADTMGGRAPIVLGGVVCLLAAAFGYYASRHFKQVGSEIV